MMWFYFFIFFAVICLHRLIYLLAQCTCARGLAGAPNRAQSPLWTKSFNQGRTIQFHTSHLCCDRQETSWSLNLLCKYVYMQVQFQSNDKISNLFSLCFFWNSVKCYFIYTTVQRFVVIVVFYSFLKKSQTLQSCNYLFKNTVNSTIMIISLQF